MTHYLFFVASDDEVVKDFVTMALSDTLHFVEYKSSHTTPLFSKVPIHGGAPGD